MKKIMFLIAGLSAVITLIWIRLLPDTVPMHYDFSGEIDRWGSKYELLLFPGLILLFALFWMFMIRVFEKKRDKAVLDRERAEAGTNVKVLKYTGLVTTAAFALEQIAILYITQRLANGETPALNLSIPRVACLLVGLLFIALGNYIPKTKKNQLVGLRISWSLYNDETWRRSNRFSAYTMVIGGIVTVVIAFLAKEEQLMIWMILCLLLSAGVSAAYAYFVYKKEKSKEELQ